MDGWVDRWVDGWVDGKVGGWHILGSAESQPGWSPLRSCPPAPSLRPLVLAPWLWGTVLGKLVVRMGCCEEKTSEQGLRRSQPDAIGKEAPIRVHSKCKGPGAGMCLRCSRTKRSCVHTHFPQKGAHTDPLTPPLTHLHTRTQAVPQVYVLVRAGLHYEHGFIVLSSLGEMETGGKGWEVGIASPQSSQGWGS